MKKLLFILLLAIPFVGFAINVPWNRPSIGVIHPLFISDKVGIGTSTPYAMLSVVGETVSSYFTATSTTQASTFPYASTTALTVSGSGSALIVTTGNVGIGTTTPKTNLDVLGTLSFDLGNSPLKKAEWTSLRYGESKLISGGTISFSGATDDWSVATTTALVNGRYWSSDSVRGTVATSTFMIAGKSIKDPFIYKEGSTYYAFYTLVDNNLSITDADIGYATSKDLKTWTDHGVLIDHNNYWGGSTYPTWAPSLIKIGSTYYMFFAGYTWGNGFLGYATSPTINGTYTFQGRVKDDSGADISLLDPQVIFYNNTYYLVAGSGKNYLYQSNNPAANSWTLISDLGGVTKQWENTFNVYEAPILIPGSPNLLFYGASDSADDQRIGLAVSNDIKGPYTKVGVDGQIFLDFPREAPGPLSHPYVFYDKESGQWYLFASAGTTANGHLDQRLIGYVSSDLISWQAISTTTQLKKGVTNYVYVNPSGQLMAAADLPYDSGRDGIFTERIGYLRLGTLTVNNSRQVTASSAYIGKQTILDYVGIGTTSPSSLLSIGGAAAGIPAIVFDAIGRATIPYASTTALTVSGSGPTLFVPTGRVGIGTNDPVSTLQIEGSGSNAASLRIRDTAGGSTGTFTVFYDNTTQSVWQKQVASGAPLMDFFPIASDGVSAATIRMFRLTNTTGAKTVVFHRGNGTTDTDAVIGVGGQNSYFQAATGRFGVGTTSPSALLSASTSVSIGFLVDQRGSDNILRLLNSGTSRLVLTAGGNLGLGTTTPGTLLSLGNTGASTINFNPTATSTFGFGLNLRGGCYAINNVCISGGSGSGTVGSGTTGQVPYYASNGTTLTATSTLYISEGGSSVTIAKGVDGSGGSNGGGSDGGTVTLAKGGNNIEDTAFAGGTVNIADGGAETGDGVGSNNHGGAGGTVNMVRGGSSEDGQYGNDGVVTIGNSAGKKNATVNLYGTLNVMFRNTATTNGVCHSGTNLNGLDTTNIYSLVACSSTPSDIAEFYPAESDVEAGHIVALSEREIEYEAEGADPHTGQVFSLGRERIAVLKRATPGAGVVGIVSTAPFQTFGRDVLKADPNAKPLALAGRVPVKVNAEGGAIRPGDRITLSSVPGVGKRAGDADGLMVGIALQSWNGSGEGRVLVLIRTN